MAPGDSRRRPSRKGKATASTSAPPRDEGDHEEHTSFPWPRPDNTPFTRRDAGREWYCEEIPHTTMRTMQRCNRYQSYRHGEPWTHHHCTFYNGLLRMEMAPTRFVCGLTLHKMGIRDDVQRMLQQIGLDQIATRQYPLYPELVRQFLASAELRYTDTAHHAASTASLSFFSSGILYDISIRDLCDVYGFDRTAEACSFPSDFPQAAELWNVIGSGAYESRGAKLSHIRNPAVRVVAKIIGNILFAKEESGALRIDELMLLHFGLPASVRDIYSIPPPTTLDTNLGVIFAESLASKKTRGLNTVNKKVERIGSLLTPLFIHLGIDLTATSQQPQITLLDEQYFRNSGILKPGYVYQFQDRTGALQYCKLPLQQFTALTSRANLEFLLPPEHLQTTSSTSRRRGSSSRASSSQHHQEDAHIPEIFPEHRQSTEYLLPARTGEFALPPYSAEATSDERIAWIVESQMRTHSMLERMWDAFARIRCPPPPSCFRAPQTTEEPPTAADAPVVAGHRTSDTDDELTEPDERLSRRRRQPGQSRSASSEDH